jgi:hypothetical protein
MRALAKARLFAQIIEPFALRPGQTICIGGESEMGRYARRISASWRSGYAEDCKSLHPSSILGEASNFFKRRSQALNAPPAAAVLGPICRQPHRTREQQTAA